MQNLIGKVVTFKLNSGEELITKVKEVDGDMLIITDPVSVAPGPQGMGLVPSMFTSDPKAEVRLNTNSISIFSITDESVKVKYIQATTGIVMPEKKILVG
jgi:small nuclear ribonucleoprotein (snRNP)-like protein